MKRILVLVLALAMALSMLAVPAMAQGKKSIEGGTSFFSDQVGIEELQAVLLKIAETRNCDLADVNYFDGDTTYAGISYGGAIGSCFGSSHMSVSAILVPRKTANKEGK